MTREFILWISLFAYALHICEEAILNWKGWVKKSGIVKNVEWSDFYIVNAAVVVLGIACSQVGWNLPFFALIFPGLQLINALFFHILPTLIQKKFSPGLITATLLFLPIGLLCYWAAFQDQVLSIGSAILSFVCAAVLMATPILFLRLRSYL